MSISNSVARSKGIDGGSNIGRFLFTPKLVTLLEKSKNSTQLPPDKRSEIDTQIGEEWVRAKEDSTLILLNELRCETCASENDPCESSRRTNDLHEVLVLCVEKIGVELLKALDEGRIKGICDMFNQVEVNYWSDHSKICPEMKQEGRDAAKGI